MVKPVYAARARVTGGRANGHGRTAGGELDVDLRMPKELGGDGGGTNPEQLFAVGYAACFEAALTLVAQRKQVVADDVTIDATVMLVPVGNGQLRLAAELDVALASIPDADQAVELVRAAHQICPYSNATRGNVDVALVVNGSPLTD